MLNLVDSGVAKGKAAKSLRVSRVTMAKWEKRRAAGDKDLQDKPRSDTKQALLDASDKKYLRQLAQKKLNLKELRERLYQHHNKLVSTSTIRRCLISGKVPRAYLPITQVYTISKLNCGRRLQFCEANLGVDKTGWVCVDACLLRYDYQTGLATRFAWQDVKKRMHQRKTQHHSYICVYAAVSINGLSPLVVVGESHKRMYVPNSEDFQRAISDLDVWLMQLPHKRAGYRFVLDNASCHTSKATREFMKLEDIRVVDGWPAQAADLNLIENLWSVLQDRLSRMNHRTFDGFKQHMKEAWGSISPETIHNLYGSWEGRFREVIARNGGGPVA
jgi:hypothetical protein